MNLPQEFVAQRTRYNPMTLRGSNYGHPFRLRSERTARWLTLKLLWLRIKGGKEVLWPLGGTLLGLVAMPVAIAQYPNFFNENQWLLPLYVVAVLACWVVPLLIHENAKRFLGHVWSKGKPGKLVAIVLVLACLMVAGLGSRNLFVFHTAHLKKAFPLKTTEIKSANPTEPAAQPPHDAAREAIANPLVPSESTKNKEKELPPPKLKSPNLLTKKKP